MERLLKSEKDFMFQNTFEQGIYYRKVARKGSKYFSEMI